MVAKEFGRVAPRVSRYLHELVGWRNALRQPAAWYGMSTAPPGCWTPTTPNGSAGASRERGFAAMQIAFPD